MKLSYLVTCSTETYTLSNLLDRLVSNLNDDELVIVLDSDATNNQPTKDILTKFSSTDKNIKILEHPLQHNYSNHKSWSAKQCKNEWLLQLDGDELPNITLLANIKDIIEANPGIESFWLPRTNDFIGVHDKIAKQWGWKLSASTSIEHCRTFKISDYEYQFLKINNYVISEHLYKVGDEELATVQYKAVLVNAYDPQCRLFLNEPEIQWVGRLHERIEGNKNYVYLPFIEELALLHDKTIDRQIQTNLMYNKLFTDQENRGFNLPK